MVEQFPRVCQLHSEPEKVAKKLPESHRVIEASHCSPCLKIAAHIAARSVWGSQQNPWNTAKMQLSLLSLVEIY
jgi:hypothetical protein